MYTHGLPIWNTVKIANPQTSDENAFFPVCFGHVLLQILIHRLHLNIIFLQCVYASEFSKSNSVKMLINRLHKKMVPFLCKFAWVFSNLDSPKNIDPHNTQENSFFYTTLQENNFFPVRVCRPVFKLELTENDDPHN